MGGIYPCVHEEKAANADGKSGAGEVVTLVFSPSDRVDELKADIHLKVGNSRRDEIRLFCRKKEENCDCAESSVVTENINAEFLSGGGFVILNANKTLGDYNIQEEDILYLVCIVCIVRISVDISTGRFINLEVNPSDTIEWVKSEIQKAKGFLVDKQQLILNGTELKDGCSLGDYNIGNGTVLDLGMRSGEPGKIEIFVKPNFMTNTIKLTVERNDLIGNVKAKIEEKEGLLAEFQELKFANWYLEDGYRLSDYNVQGEDIICLEGGDIFVRDLGGGTLTFKVENDYTIETIKVKIHDKTGIPVTDLRLVDAGKLLEDGRTLPSYGIKKHSFVHLILLRSVKAASIPGRIYRAKK